MQGLEKLIGKSAKKHCSRLDFISVITSRLLV